MATTFQEDNWQHIISFGGRGVHFDTDGAQYYTSSLTATETALQLYSLWFRNPPDGVTFWTSVQTESWSDNPLPACQVVYSGGQIAVIVQRYADADYEEVWQFIASFAAPSATNGEWHHALVATNTNGMTATASFDGVPVAVDTFSLHQSTPPDEDPVIDNPSPPFTGRLNGIPFGITSLNGYLVRLTGLDIAEAWFNTTSGLVDATDPAIIAKFFTAGHTPADLGTDGSAPFGTPPIMYGKGGADTFLAPNLGTGGGLVLTPTVINAEGRVHLGP